MFEDFIMAKLTMDDLVDKIESKFTDSEIDGIRIRGCQICLLYTSPSPRD